MTDNSPGGWDKERKPFACDRIFTVKSTKCFGYDGSSYIDKNNYSRCYQIYYHATFYHHQDHEDDASFRFIMIVWDKYLEKNLVKGFGREAADDEDSQLIVFFHHYYSQSWYGGGVPERSHLKQHILPVLLLPQLQDRCKGLWPFRRPQQSQQFHIHPLHHLL